MHKDKVILAPFVEESGASYTKMRPALNGWHAASLTLDDLGMLGERAAGNDDGHT